MSAPALLSALEARILFIGSVDPSWKFDSGAIEAAAGQQLYFDTGVAVDAGRGRTLLLAGSRSTSDGGATIVIALDSNGRLDRSFSRDGLADTGLFDNPSDYNDSPTLTVDADGYAYVAHNVGLVRFTGDGRRDPTFAEGNVIQWAGRDATNQVLDFKPDNAGGVDIVRTVYRGAGTETAPAPGYTQLLHVTGAGATGRSTVMWADRYNDSTDLIKPTVPHASVTRTSTGGWVVVSDRQRYTPNDDISSPFDPAQADARVTFIDATGNVTRDRTFDIGQDADLSNIVVQHDGAKVTFEYGDSYDQSARQLRLFNGTRVTRSPPPAPYRYDRLKNGKVLEFQTNSHDHGRNPTTYSFFAKLLNVDGTPDLAFGVQGVLDVTAIIGAEESHYPYAISPNADTVLMAWSDYDSARQRGVVNIVKLWTTDAPAVTLTGVKTASSVTTISVMYRAESGISLKTLNSADLQLTRGNKQSVALKFVGAEAIDGGYIARYRVAGLRAGNYTVALAAGQAASVSGAANVEEDLDTINIG